MSPEPRNTLLAAAGAAHRTVTDLNYIVLSGVKDSDISSHFTAKHIYHNCCRVIGRLKIIISAEIVVT